MIFNVESAKCVKYAKCAGSAKVVEYAIFAGYVRCTTPNVQGTLGMQGMSYVLDMPNKVWFLCQYPNLTLTCYVLSMLILLYSDQDVTPTLS